MKRIIPLVFAALCLLLVPKTAQAYDYDFTAGGVFYNINADDPTTVSVTSGDGDNAYSGDVIIPESVSDGTNTYTVTAIGSLAMANCTGVTSITLPSTITLLDDRCFVSTGITEITIPEAVTVIGECSFQFCASLIEVVIPDAVTAIRDAAFYGCSGLQTVTIGTGLSSFTGPNGTFNGCTSLALIICRSTTPPVIRALDLTGIWPDVSHIRIRVPCESVAAYNAADIWEAMDVRSLVEVVSVATGDATDVSDYFATLHKEVELTNACGIQGFQYRVTGAPEWSTSADGILTDLTPETNYEFRAYAQGTIKEGIIDDYTEYGDTKSFSTVAAIPRTVTFNAGTGVSVASITDTSVELPEATACDASWIFAGWSETRVSATAAAPALVAGPYIPKVETTLYAVYSKTETAPVPAYSPDATARQFVVAAKVGDVYYAASLTVSQNALSGTAITTNTDEEQVYVTSINAAGKAWTIVRTDDNITIADGNNYLKKSGNNNNANITKSAGSYSWAISAGSYGTYRITCSGTSSTRALAYGTSNSRFTAYTAADINGTTYYDIELIPIQEINTTYASFPICAETVTRTVSFESNGGSEVASQTLANSDVAVRPVAPARENFAFENWYSDAALTTLYDFSTPVTADITLYAKWTVTKFSVAGIWYRITSDGEVEVSFSGAAWNTVAGEYAGDVVIPETVTYEELTCTVTAVGDHAFRESAGEGQVTSVTLPGTITYIGAYAFDGQLFTSITIPAAVTQIGDYALDGSVLTEVICWAVTPPYIYAAFGDDESYAMLYVPCASLADYISDETYWPWYFYPDGYIVGIPDVATVDATEITSAAAALNVVLDGCAEEIVDQGYLWRSAADAAQNPGLRQPPCFIADAGVDDAGWHKSADGLLTGLTPGTEYQFRAYATAADIGTSYGAIKTFTTLSVHTVTFESNGGSDVPSQTVEYNGKATEPVPTKAGYIFEGWYSDVELTTPYDFDTPVTADITLYAKWRPLTSLSNVNGNGTFSVFVQNNSLVANINLPEAGTVDINIYDLQGALLLTENSTLPAGNNLKTLNAGLIQGIYIVKIVYKNTVTRVKVVK
jgi:uncharacterized repeat protein (TIGR02543 family)